MIYGLLRPVLLLPETAISEDDIEWIFRHELVHYRRLDIAYKLLLLLANAVHWFNPLVWLMLRQAGRDLEISCDEEVLRQASDGERRRYGDVLLRLMHSGRSCPAALSTCFSKGTRSVKERFARIYDSRAKKRGIAAIAVVAATALTVGGLVACSSGEQLTFPYPMGSGEVMLADGGRAEIEVRMTSGKLITSDAPDYVAGGGMNGMFGSKNYIGTYELAVRRNGKDVSVLPVDFFGGETQLTMTEPVAISTYDYNGDGNPELTFGVWGSSSVWLYNLYSIAADGTLTLEEREIPANPQGSTLLFAPVDGGFQTQDYTNGDGEARQSRYLWNETEGTYERYILVEQLEYQAFQQNGGGGTAIPPIVLPGENQSVWILDSMLDSEGFSAFSPANP